MIAPMTDTAFLADLDARWLGGDGRIRLLPAAEFRSVPWEHLRLWLHFRARYALPTAELVDWLKARIAGRSAVEAGAGNGDLGHHLGIPMTDSGCQQRPEVALYYKAIGHAPTRPGPGVDVLDAHQAVQAYRPRVVVASWLTRKFIEGQDGPESGASVYGPVEEGLLDAPGVETYIHIGARHVHGGKTLLRRPHEEIRLPGLVSRSQDPTQDVIYVWEKGA